MSLIRHVREAVWERKRLTSGDSSARMTAPLVLTWMTFGEGNGGAGMADDAELAAAGASRGHS